MVERTVFIHLPGETEAVPAGRLTMIEQGLQVQASTFAYGRRYVTRTNALAVDPIALALVGRNDEERVPAGGLAMFGALRDAAPDAWGRRVIENRLRAPPNGLPESVYLDHAGPHRAGALDVRESPTSPQRAVRCLRSSTCAICWMSRRGSRKASRCRHTWRSSSPAALPWAAHGRRRW